VLRLAGVIAGRRSELLGLWWEDLDLRDLDAATIRFTHRSCSRTCCAACGARRCRGSRTSARSVTAAMDCDDAEEASRDLLRRRSSNVTRGMEP
jgi:hypothetical protein